MFCHYQLRFTSQISNAAIAKSPRKHLGTPCGQYCNIGSINCTRTPCTFLLVGQSGTRFQNKPLLMKLYQSINTPSPATASFPPQNPQKKVVSLTPPPLPESPNPHKGCIVGVYYLLMYNANSLDGKPVLIRISVLSLFLLLFQ